jgi:hypothetical protein
MVNNPMSRLCILNYQTKKSSALAAALKRMIAQDRYPLSPRIQKAESDPG